MANIGKITTKATSDLFSVEYAKTTERFSAALRNELKVKDLPKLDEFKKLVTSNEAEESLKNIAPKLAKEPPLWKKVIGKIFG